MAETGGHRPMMPDERVELLRRWHEAAIAAGRRDREITVSQQGCRFVVPPDVYPPNPLGLSAIVADEVADGERVLDMGTGSGVNGIVAAARAGQVVAVDVNPAAVECANRNAERNGVRRRFHAVVGDLFDHVEGSFHVIVFDPPFRWFAPRSMAERGTADEDYRTLTAFFDQAAGHLAPGGRILLSFGTTGDIAYLHHLIETAGYVCDELRRVVGEKDGVEVAYYAYRLTGRAT